MHWLLHRGAEAAPFRQSPSPLQSLAHQRELDRRLHAVRIAGAFVRWTSLPGICALAFVSLRGAIHAVGLFNIATVGLGAMWAVGYGVLRSLGKRLAREADSLQEELFDVSEDAPPP
jgi:hypothetical protein